ncbi:MAG: hypothetical protein DCF16_17425 [Alphaproteobacteria bacterium]|nr:MAG: hypothetical protein DCF16_17425 [Alphaproteobacteria bacterium]
MNESLRRALAPGQAGVFNGAMKHALLAAALAALAACASPATDAPDPDLAFALGHDLSCNASEQRAPNGEVSTLHISLSVPDRGGAGEFCIMTGCEAATFEPTLTRALGWTAVMRTNDRTNYNANLEISRDLRAFTLAEGEGGGVWTGTCNAAGS